jgi:succinate dehydrogenase / fumarate reductase, cytochrome b subunit
MLALSENSYRRKNRDLMANSYTIPRAFIWKRAHSLTGLFLVLYIIEHLLVNSRAAFSIGEDGMGFIKAVNAIHDLPYLPFIEFFLLGVPIVVHMFWGVVYLRTGQQNYYGGNGAVPSLSEYPRNRAYTWQRITSWILLVGIIAHVIQMRFLEYPTVVSFDGAKSYMVRVDSDPGLYTLSKRLGFDLYDQKQIAENKLNAFYHAPLKDNQLLASTKSFGMAELLMVRETFKMPLMIVLYTIFVISACYHGFNGLWTFLITWGVTLTRRSQRLMLNVATCLMVLVTFWGLSAIWITYWVNLKQ